MLTKLGFSPAKSIKLLGRPFGVLGSKINNKVNQYTANRAMLGFNKARSLPVAQQAKGYHLARKRANRYARLSRAFNNGTRTGVGVAAVGLGSVGLAGTALGLLNKKSKNRYTYG